MDIEEVRKLAHLARISVSDEELEGFAKDIGNIIGFVDRVRTVELGIAPDTAGSETNVFRDDMVDPLAGVYDLVECAPLHQDGFVKVPKVIE
ncbi:MAG: Asp-tRNA(Asn)/Glu-tRNA(Gln) amidotransferase subunit GatC [Candidatus Pacebacteria bacterium]|nr:Asp-tRNA(Asn)/Glu-tRNA(Gln) amidotransferase subunit GatC [Candidatus Paceibacterota bacterium]MBP9701220.1 Asp-tRNA(Asn)/Glu-tRNA(Gln) amidotransferase subunit GatC [Candidatus Paceibacterota bacterium]